MTKNKHFGDKVRQERNRQHLTVAQVAGSCGISRSYLTLIENGHRLPGKKNIPKIASALGLKTTIVLNWYLEDIASTIKSL